MTIPSIQELQPYFAALGTVFSLATFGFVLNLAKAMSDAAKMRAEVLEERLKSSKDDVDRTKEEVERTVKWSEREKRKLQEEIDGLRSQVTASLETAGVTTSLDAKDAVARLSKEFKDTLDSRLLQITELLAKQEKVSDVGITEPATALQLGRGYLATGQWLLAIKYLEIYLSHDPNDWDTQFARGVAFANARVDRSSNLGALRSYNEAIAFGMEPDAVVTDSFRARAFIYRGAILKRLGRFDEAEMDLKTGERLASSDYEKADAAYNLACVYAMSSRKTDLLRILRDSQSLKNRNYVLRSVKGHLKDYFRDYALDGEVLDAIRLLQ